MTKTDAAFVADYLEDLAKKIRAGTHSVAIEKTEFERKVSVDFYEGEMYESDCGVDDSQWRETLRVSKNNQRVIS